MKMSVKRIGEVAAKAALAGLALAVLTAASAPAKATVVTWDLWIAFDPVKVAAGKSSMMTGEWVDPNPFGITMATEATGHLTFNNAGCGAFFCGPVEDPSFDIHFEFDGTPIAFGTGDDFRYNETTNAYNDPTNPGPTVGFIAFGGNTYVTGMDFNVPFAHNTVFDNVALSIESGVVELYDLTNQTGFPNWTVLRGTLCTNGYGEPGEGDVCYRGTDTEIVTPIPAALPLFGSGLVAMGLAAWRRRRNV
jgi:hypothetical protein